MTPTAEPTVYFVNFQGQDGVADAKNHGHIKAITTGRIETFKVDLLLQAVNEALKDSKPGDWLVFTGHAIVCSLAAIEFVRRHQRLNVLLWHAAQRKYLPRIMKLSLTEDLSNPFLEHMLQPGEVPLDL